MLPRSILDLVTAFLEDDSALQLTTCNRTCAFYLGWLRELCLAKIIDRVAHV